MQERLIQLLALLPSHAPGAADPASPDHLDGRLCAALCLEEADDPVAVLDAGWGEEWAEALMEQELLDEFMAWLEERWQTLRDALDLPRLQQDPDALPLAEALPWAAKQAAARTGSRQLPDAARAWADGFLSHARASGIEPDAELRSVIAALLLEDGPPLKAYLLEAYDRPQEIDAAALIDDALFAAQDLRRATG